MATSLNLRKGQDRECDILTAIGSTIKRRTKVDSTQYLQPDDDRPTAVSVSMVGVVQPVEHVRARSHVYITPELRAFLVSAVNGYGVNAIFSHNSLHRHHIHRVQIKKVPLKKGKI